MSENVISVLTGGAPSGLSPHQFRKIDQFYCLAASAKVLTHRAVDCDFEEGIMTITLSKSAHHAPQVRFIARRVGPKTTMYELYLDGKGRAIKSALFERVFNAYRDYVEALIEAS